MRTMQAMRVKIPQLLVALLVVLPVMLSAPRAWAVNPDEMLDDPKLEARARELSKGLRCVVCQNENIDESNADLAKDIRILLRERLKAGDTDEQAVNYLVERYGEFVLLKPRFAPHTLLLWAGPFLVLLIGLITLWRLRARAATAGQKTEAALSDEEKKRLEELLKDKE